VICFSCQQSEVRSHELAVALLDFRPRNLSRQADQDTQRPIWRALAAPGIGGPRIEGGRKYLEKLKKKKKT